MRSQINTLKYNVHYRSKNPIAGSQEDTKFKALCIIDRNYLSTIYIYVFFYTCNIFKQHAYKKSACFVYIYIYIYIYYVISAVLMGFRMDIHIQKCITHTYLYRLDTVYLLIYEIVVIFYICFYLI